jgi:peptidoglycan-N-acetylglucosamine deacetylase
MLDAIKKSGRHEFGVHGWIHEMNMTLPDSVERALVRRALDDLTRITGRRPTGYRAPSWNFSPNTLSILRELGFRYESSLMADDSPYEILQNGQPTGIVELPVEWIQRGRYAGRSGGPHTRSLPRQEMTGSTGSVQNGDAGPSGS